MAGFYFTDKPFREKLNYLLLISMTITDFYTKAQEKLTSFARFVETTGAETRIIADHFGYRCESHSEFIDLRAFLEGQAHFFYQSVVAGRPIALFKLIQPVNTPAGDLHYLELADQKPDGSQKSGFDHVEFFPKEGDNPDIVAYFAEKNFPFQKTERPHHVTHDFRLENGLTIRLEAEPLIEKILREMQGSP